jgi:Na+/melibiose symporter-like transporter
VQVTISIAQAGQQGLIPDLVSTERRGVAAGWKGLSDVGGASLGFVVLGSLLESGGVTAALLVAGVLLAVTYAVMLLLVDERFRRSEPRSGAASNVSFASAYRIVLPRDAAFVRLVMARFSFLLGIFGVGRFFLFFVEERLGLGAAEAGAMLGVFAVVTVVASLPVGWLADRYGRLPIMRVGVVLAVVGVGSLIPAGSVTLVLLAGGFMALGSAAFGAANWAATTDVVTDGEAARLMGLANFGTAGAAAAAGLLGPLIDASEGVASGEGYNLLFVIAIVFMAVSALIVHRIDETEPGRITA